MNHNVLITKPSLKFKEDQKIRKIDILIKIVKKILTTDLEFICS